MIIRLLMLLGLAKNVAQPSPILATKCANPPLAPDEATTPGDESYVSLTTDHGRTSSTNPPMAADIGT